MAHPMTRSDDRSAFALAFPLHPHSQPQSAVGPAESAEIRAPEPRVWGSREAPPGEILPFGSIAA